MITETQDSTCIRKDPCPECGSSDACAVYDDGHAYCFSCEAHFPKYEEGDHQAEEREHARDDLFHVVYQAIPSRGITHAVARSNGYGVSGKYQVAEYCDATGKVVAQKLKTADKQFSILGDARQMKLWPMWRFKPGGKRLLITEGETDLLAWQSLAAQGDKWPVVSLPNGASAAKKAVAKSLEFVESFDQVILCFDSDEPGQKAAEEVCQILTPGKAHIMRIPNGCKDICEAIQNGYQRELTDAYWNAAPYRPDGIVGGDEILEALLKPPEPGIPYPWDGLNQKLMGLRQRELITVTAGTGVGKSSFVGLLAHHLVKQGVRVGYISLEESLGRTAERLVGAELGKPLHISREGVADQQLTDTWNGTFAGRVVVFNHFGSMDAAMLTQRIKYMRVAEGVDFVFLDHLSILVSGWGDGDERRLIDNVMTELRSICEQTGVGMILISHLRNPVGGEKSHEEGGRPKLNQLRGSKAISQISDGVIALQRDQQCEEHPNRTNIFVLKNRFSGQLGLACVLDYDNETGRMEEADARAEDFGF